MNISEKHLVFHAVLNNNNNIDNNNKIAKHEGHVRVCDAIMLWYYMDKIRGLKKK